jgi:hypothetical protein
MMTGVIDMMAQFKRDTKVAAASAAAGTKSSSGNSFLRVPSRTADVSNRTADVSDMLGNGRKSTFQQESLQVTHSFLDQTGGAGHMSVNVIGRSQFLNVSKMNSFANLSSAVPAADNSTIQVPELEASAAASFTDRRSMLDTSASVPVLEMSAALPALEESAFGAPALDESASAGPALDESAFVPALDTSEPTGHDNVTLHDMEEDEDVANEVSRLTITTMDMGAVQDPFDEAMQMQLLDQIPMPLTRRHGYHRLTGQNMPAFKTNREVRIGTVDFLIGELKGEGAYGKVFKAMKREEGDDAPNETISDMDVVVKIQKPACEWEYYIGTEIHYRLNRSASSGHFGWFMSIPRCFTFDDGSVLVSEHQQLGTLLDVVNAMSTLKKTLYETVAVYFVIEMLIVAKKLRQMEIIHGDVKSDNFLLLEL